MKTIGPRGWGHPSKSLLCRLVTDPASPTGNCTFDMEGDDCWIVARRSIHRHSHMQNGAVQVQDGIQRIHVQVPRERAVLDDDIQGLCPGRDTDGQGSVRREKGPIIAEGAVVYVNLK